MSSISNNDRRYRRKTGSPPSACRWAVCFFLLLLLTPDSGAGAQLPDSAAQPPDLGAKAVQISFQGNQDLSGRELRQAASYEIDQLLENKRRADADDAAFQMELAYRQQGFAFAEVDYDYEVGPEEVAVTFRISEGPQVRIGRIRIEGNTVFSKEDLRTFFQPEPEGLLPAGPNVYVRSEARRALDEIRDLYYNRGYLDVKISGPETEFRDDRKQVNLSLAIAEGIRYLIQEVEFQGDVLPEARQELTRAGVGLQGEPFFRRQVFELRSRIQEIYGNLGYPDTQVEADAQERENGEMVLQAAINSGPQVRVQEIMIQGNAETRESFIRSRLALQPGDLYTSEAQRRSFRNLYQTGLFAKVDLSLRNGAASQRTLLVEVEELPYRQLAFEAGWGSYELLRLRVEFQQKNPFGYGRLVKTELGGSLKGEEVLVSISDPWFLRREINAELPFYYRRREEPAFTRREIGTSLLFSKDLTGNLKVTFGYDFRVTSLTDLSLNTVVEDFDQNYNIGSLQSRLTYDTRNDIFFPTGGQESFITGEFADSALGGQVAFYRLTGGHRHFYALNRDTVLGLRYETGFVLPHRGQDTIPLGERYFNGGERSVRSFHQDQLGPKDSNGEPIGGTAFNLLSAELRHRLSGLLIGTLFVDLGNIAPNRETTLFGTDESTLTSATFSDYFDDFRPAIGAGLQYLLPVGPARLDFAVNPDPREGEREYTIHFSLGMAF